MGLEFFQSSKAFTGRDERQLCSAPAELDGRDAPDETPLLLHPETIKSLMRLRLEARFQGIDLRVASGYRSFERQRSIWNRKCSGELPLYDSQGRLLDALSLSSSQLLDALSRWSALPGASRHHWGSDVDLIDAVPVQKGYIAQLLPEEYAEGGAFAQLGNWLDERLSQRGCEFARPYDRDRGGVAPEPWHLSCRRVATEAEAAFSPEQLQQLLQSEEIALSQEVLRDLSGYWNRWIASAFVAERPT